MAAYQRQMDEAEGNYRSHDASAPPASAHPNRSQGGAYPSVYGAVPVGVPVAAPVGAPAYAPQQPYQQQQQPPMQQQGAPAQPVHYVQYPAAPYALPVAAGPGHAGGPYAAAYPGVHGAGASTVVHSQACHVDALHKFILLASFALVLCLLVWQVFLVTGDSSVTLWLSLYLLLVLVILAAAIYWKLPTRCDLTPSGVVVHTRGTSYALSFERVSKIAVCRSALCYAGAMCTLPRTKFSSVRDGVFFHSLDCASAIGFSPVDMQQFVAVLQRLPAANGKIVYA